MSLLAVGCAIPVRFPISTGPLVPVLKRSQTKTPAPLYDASGRKTEEVAADNVGATGTILTGVLAQRNLV